MSSAVQFQVSCGCGTQFSVSLTAAAVKAESGRPSGTGHWTCPSCCSAWRPDHPSAERAQTLVSTLTRLRRLAIGIPIVVGVLFGLLAIWRPSLIVTVPLAVGLVMVVLRRPYRGRLLAIYRQLSEFTLVRIKL